MGLVRRSSGFPSKEAIAEFSKFEMSGRWIWREFSYLKLPTSLYSVSDLSISALNNSIAKLRWVAGRAKPSRSMNLSDDSIEIRTSLAAGSFCCESPAFIDAPASPVSVHRSLGLL
jgi:hypothetical protein